MPRIGRALLLVQQRPPEPRCWTPLSPSHPRTPPQTAAPVFARMSLEYTGVTFVKVNVDEAKDVASELRISAMPTFKLFRGQAELKAQQGWAEGEVRKMLAEAGAVRAAPPAKQD